jgi:DNA polymerase-3 subunit gamma/tau
LKTLEEPPPHVKFIFATTEVDRIPITILSRCQRFDFAGISLPRIVERLEQIVEKENVKADKEALELLARRAGGSMRDAQSLLDQLLAFGGDRLTSDQVCHLLGTAGDERVLGLADAVISQDAKKALELLDEACVGGLQLGELVDQLMTYWRDLMIVQYAGTEGRDLSVPARHHDTLRKHSKAVGADAVLAGLDVLSATRARLKGSAHARTLVEMALVRLTRLSDLASLSQLSQWISQVRLDPRAAALPPTAGGRVAPPEGVKKNSLMASLESPPSAPEGPQPLTDATLPTIWREVVGAVGVMHGAELKSGGLPAIIGPNTLALRFGPAYNVSRDYCQTPERIARVEAALRKLTGQSWALRVEEDRTQPAPAKPATNSPPEANRPKRSPKEEVEKIALVKRALDVFGATITRVDERFGEAAPDETRPGRTEES